MNCVHVYKEVGVEVCPHCGKDTHKTDWVTIAAQRQAHRENVGLFYNVKEWWSI